MAKIPMACPEKLSWQDKYYLASSIVMLMLGGLILTRLFLSRLFLLPLVLAGLGFMGFSLYRLSFYWAYYREKRRRQGLEYRIHKVEHFIS